MVSEKLYRGTKMQFVDFMLCEFETGLKLYNSSLLKNIPKLMVIQIYCICQLWK